eukprot:2952224-Prymnesium_polylepis.2
MQMRRRKHSEPRRTKRAGALLHENQFLQRCNTVGEGDNAADQLVGQETPPCGGILMRRQNLLTVWVAPVRRALGDDGGSAQCVAACDDEYATSTPCMNGSFNIHVYTLARTARLTPLHATRSASQQSPPSVQVVMANATEIIDLLERLDDDQLNFHALCNLGIADLKRASRGPKIPIC